MILALFLGVGLGIFTGESSYRTPIVGLFGAMFVSSAFLSFKSTDAAVRKKSSFVLYGGGLFFIVSIFVFKDHPVVNQFISGAAGLLGIEYDVGGDVATRERGDSSGTAETRTMFWSGIVNHAFSDESVLFFGNGHYLSFFERIFPYSDFVDLELLEPHNSFLGFFYRYGLIGIALLVVHLYQVTDFRKELQSRDYGFYLASLVLAVNYAFFEVALESPHGALCFWIVIIGAKFYRQNMRDE